MDSKPGKPLQGTHLVVPLQSAARRPWLGPQGWWPNQKDRGTGHVWHSDPYSFPSDPGRKVLTSYSSQRDLWQSRQHLCPAEPEDETHANFGLPHAAYRHAPLGWSSIGTFSWSGITTNGRMNSLIPTSRAFDLTVNFQWARLFPISNFYGPFWMTRRLALIPLDPIPNVVRPTHRPPKVHWSLVVAADFLLTVVNFTPEPVFLDSFCMSW